MKLFRDLLKYYDGLYNLHLEESFSKRRDMDCFFTEVLALRFFDLNFSISNVSSECSRQKIGVKTPDWIIEVEDQLIIIEAYNQKISNRNGLKRAKVLLNKFVVLDINTGRLENRNVKEKYDKYIPLIKQMNAIYFIFFNVDFLADDDKISLFSFLYGTSCHDITGVIDAHYTCFLEGLYYRSESSRYINGVILYKDNEVVYFHNYNSITSVPPNIREVLMKFQYYDV